MLLLSFAPAETELDSWQDWFHLRLSSIKKEVNTGHNITQDTLVFKVEFLPEACRPCLILAPLCVPTVGAISAPSQAENVPISDSSSFYSGSQRKVLLLCMCSISASCLGTHLFQMTGVGNNHPFRGGQVFSGLRSHRLQHCHQTKIRYSDLDIQKEYTSPLWLAPVP